MLHHPTVPQLDDLPKVCFACDGTSKEFKKRGNQNSTKDTNVHQGTHIVHISVKHIRYCEDLHLSPEVLTSEAD